MTTIICANTGRLRILKVSQPETMVDPPNQISEIANEELEDGPQRIGEITSDQAGRFRSDGTPGMGQGDANALEREEERRLICQLAGRIGDALQDGGTERWVLAAPQTINARLLEELDPSLREGLITNEKHDFTKLPTLEVGRRLGLIE
jgi:hypothetical protein